MYRWRTKTYDPRHIVRVEMCVGRPRSTGRGQFVPERRGTHARVVKPKKRVTNGRVKKTAAAALVSVVAI